LGEDASQQLHPWHHPRCEAMCPGNLNIQAQFDKLAKEMSQPSPGSHRSARQPYRGAGAASRTLTGSEGKKRRGEESGEGWHRQPLLQQSQPSPDP
jgi:hypothetical protein